MAGSDTNLILLFCDLCLLFLCVFFSLLDVGQDFLPIFIVFYTGQLLLVAKFPHQSFTDVPHMYLEVVLMTMRPAKKGFERRSKLFADIACGIGVDSQFGETKGGLDNFSIRRVEEDHHRGKDFIGHFRRNITWNNKLVRG